MPANRRFCGKLDPSFGEGGVVVMPVGTLKDYASAVAIGPGGLIAVTGISESPNTCLKSPNPCTEPGSPC